MQKLWNKFNLLLLLNRMDPAKQHAVVKIPETGAQDWVEVVHSTWLENSGEGLRTWWPPGNFKVKAKKGLSPDKAMWTSYRCVLLKYQGKCTPSF